MSLLTQSKRDAAYKVFPYPCVGSYRFLDLSVSYLPAYKEIVSRLKTENNTLLDLGCCFGQDLRRLVYDGAPAESLYGADLRLEFMNLGYDLFLDKDSFKARFIEADIFDQGSGLKQLDGKVDMIVSSAFFHLFDLEEQKTVARRIIRLLKPKKDSLLVGRQMGSEVAGRRERRSSPNKYMFRHNPESWSMLWKEIGETGTKWEVYAAADKMDGTIRAKASRDFRPGDIRWLVFCVRRLE